MKLQLKILGIPEFQGKKKPKKAKKQVIILVQRRSSNSIQKYSNKTEFRLLPVYQTTR